MDIDDLRDKVAKMKFEYNSNEKEMLEIKKKLEEYNIKDFKNIDSKLEDISNEIDEIDIDKKNYFDKAKKLIEEMEEE